jgi:hypothetical protein
MGRTDYLRFSALLGHDPVKADATPRERAASLPAWISDELVATEAARRRLRHWAIDLKQPILTRRGVDRDLTIMGIEALRWQIVGAIWKTPPPVRSYVVRNCWIIGVEPGCDGWTWQAPRVRGNLQLVVIDAKSSRDTWSTVGHEIAHAWLLRAEPPDRVSSIRDRRERAEVQANAARECGRPLYFASQTVRDEVLAARLARRWGFRGIAADPDLCADHARFAAMRSW